MELRDICQYSTDRVSANSLTKSNYISTENMLSDKGGVTIAIGIPAGNAVAFADGDVLVSNIRPYFKKIWQADKEGGCSADVLCFRPNENVNKRFFYYLLSQQTFFDYVMSGSKGCKMPRGDKKQIMQWRVNLPDMEEQRRIAAVLSSLDAKIELNRRINDNLEQQAGALFRSWFVDFEPFGGVMPEEWEIIRVGDVPCTIETGKRPKGGVSNITKGVPSIGAESVKGIGYYDYSKTKYITEEYAETLRKGKIRDYDLLIYKDGGKPGYFIPNFSIMGEGFPYELMYLNEHVFRLDFGDRRKNIFGYFYFNTERVRSFLNSVGGKAAIPGINQRNVEDIEMISPSTEQVLKFGDITYPLIKTILQNSKESARLSQLRDTLLPKLMSGELKVNEIKE